VVVGEEAQSSKLKAQSSQGIEDEKMPKMPKRGNA
jgi:hypothetical protein